jgi:hypothetical protein
MAEAGRWKAYTQRQGQLLPAFVEEALARSDPVFFIEEAVEQLQLAPLEARYATLGEHAYHPRLLLELWRYGASQGVYSGREIARRCRRDLGFRYLVGDSAVPDFRTINRSFADPEANMMRVGNDGALTYAYNAQAAGSEDGCIVATTVVTTAADSGQLVPMVDAIRATTGCRPPLTLADKGYLTEVALRVLRRRRVRCLVAVGREGKATRWPRGRYTQRMHRLLRLPWARRLYARRKPQGERPFAEIKQAMGFRRFRLRGRAKVLGEWNLVSAASNLRHLHALTLAPA